MKEFTFKTDEEQIIKIFIAKYNFVEIFSNTYARGFYKDTKIYWDAGCHLSKKDLNFCYDFCHRYFKNLKLYW